jgi:hypothetical protein
MKYFDNLVIGGTYLTARLKKIKPNEKQIYLFPCLTN